MWLVRDSEGYELYENEPMWSLDGWCYVNERDDWMGTEESDIVLEIGEKVEVVLVKK